MHESKGTGQSEVTWLVNRAIDGFRTIFTKLAESPVGVEKGIYALDNAMVDGGNAWLKSATKESEKENTA